MCAHACELEKSAGVREPCRPEKYLTYVSPHTGRKGDIMNMKRRIIVIAALMLTALVAWTCAGAEPGEGLISSCTLEQLFEYRDCLNPEIQDQPDFDKVDLVFVTPKANADYSARVMSYAHAVTSEQTVGGLRFTASRALAVNNLCAVEWTIENVADEARLLVAGVPLTDGKGGACSINTGSGKVLLPGERMRCATQTMTPGLEGDTCEFSIAYSEYRIAQDAIPADRTKDCQPDEEDVELLGEATFSLTLDRASAPVMSALKPGEVREIEWQGSTLRITEAWQSISDGSYTVMRIFDTREEALAHDVWGDDWWDMQPYTALSEEGHGWIKVGGGEADDEPVQLEDGRWGFSMTHTAALLNWLPDGKVYMVPWLPGEDGLAVPQWDSAVELALQYELGGQTEPGE